MGSLLQTAVQAKAVGYCVLGNICLRPIVLFTETYCIGMASLTQRPHTQTSMCINSSAQDICDMRMKVGLRLLVSNSGINLTIT